MKKYTSKVLRIISYGFLTFPILYLIFAAVVFDIPFSAAAGLLLSPFYYFLCLWAVFTGWGLLNMHRWVWVVFWITNALIFYESLHLLLTQGETHNQGLAFLLLIGFQAVVIYNVVKEIYVPYFLPRIRWWESGGGYQFSLPVEVSAGSKMSFEGKILDLSIKGCFIKLSPTPPRDTDVNLRFNIFGQIMACPGTVVWIAQSSVTTPGGVGIKFRRMDRAKRRRLRIAGMRMRSITNFYYRAKDKEDQRSLIRTLEVLQKKNDN